jgi:hypothetical protein
MAMQDGEEFWGRIYEEETRWLFLPIPQPFCWSPLSVAENRRPDPTGRGILVGETADWDATAYAVESILRGALGEEENLG